jgi:DAACS family dicarboxylate/amino acid:cation (Na+ or H+) symporter
MSERVTEAAPSRRRLRFPLYARILAAMVLGALTGLLGGSRAAPLGELGALVIQLIKAIAAPLLFFTIAHAIATTRVELRSGLRMLLLASVNAAIALALGLGLSNLFLPGTWLAGTHGGNAGAYQDKTLDLMETLAGYVPRSIVQPFADNLILSVILLAVLLGAGLRRARSAHPEQLVYERLTESLAGLLEVVRVVLVWVIQLVPLAVFGAVARTVGQYGLAPGRGLALYVAVAVGGMLLHVLVTYHAWLWLFAKLPLHRFWREAREPVVYALGSNSSLATLPLTLAALDRLGVSRASSALGAGVGTNLNNDGILLYEGMAVLFVAQAAGLQLSFEQQLIAAGLAMIASMGVAGVPEAGFISVALVLNTVGLPVELLPLLLTVDWVVARARSVTNVLSDMVLSINLDRWELLSLSRQSQRPPAPP